MGVLLSAASEPDIKSQLLKGRATGDATFRVHIDGYDQSVVLADPEAQDPRRSFFYWTDDGDLAGLRYDQYKAVFMEQQAHGLEVWMQPLVPLRAPKIFNLRSDPFEHAEIEAGGYDRWFVEHMFVLLPAQQIVAQELATYRDFPPRQRPGSFSIDKVMDMLMDTTNN